MDAKLDILEGTTGASLQRDDVWEDKSLTEAGGTSGDKH